MQSCQLGPILTILPLLLSLFVSVRPIPWSILCAAEQVKKMLTGIEHVELAPCCFTHLLICHSAQSLLTQLLVQLPPYRTLGGSILQQASVQATLFQNGVNWYHFFWPPANQQPRCRWPHNTLHGKCSLGIPMRWLSQWSWCRLIITSILM